VNGYLMVVDLRVDLGLMVFWMDYLMDWMFLVLGERKLLDG
jgi:hypothetical protein